MFQCWHAFQASKGEWMPVDSSDGGQGADSTSQMPTLKLLTWNIDAFGDKPVARINGILSKLQRSFEGGDHSGPDIVFFQEVSTEALDFVLENTWIKENWISSEADGIKWSGVPFATMTLLSRARFGSHLGSPEQQNGDASLFSLGPIWRVGFPSRYSRDALCCDIFWGKNTRVRLINVHLDSLNSPPVKRPQQVAIAASLLRTAGVGRGLIAGDWNPVSKQDLTLVQENNLVDAWEKLRPGEDGFTWGLDGKGAPFPPGRLDKVAMLGLEPVDISVVHPEVLSEAATDGGSSTGETDADGEGEAEVPWSDHSGLLCSFRLGDVA